MEKIKQFLSSYKTTIVLLLLYAAVMAAATFVEKYRGTEAAKLLVYYSPLFIFLQFLLVVNFVLILIEKAYIKRKKWALVTVHAAFIVILAGAMVTHLFGKEGSVHIREGQIIDEMVIRSSRGMSFEKLPFSLELTDFRLNRYPGSASPSSYESDLIVHVDGETREAKVFMNNVLDVKGYRFFQASYDQDEQGTILSANKDVAGRIITYTGYFLLLVGFLLVFVTKNSRFWKLNRRLKEVRNAAKNIPAVLFLLIFSITASAQTMPGESMMEAVQKNAVSISHASAFGALPMQSGGRIMPVNTFSSEILRKIYKEQQIGRLNSDQFLLGFLAMPQMWIQVPFIAVENNDISARYQLPEDYASYAQFFDANGNYKLLPQLQELYHKAPAERTRTEKDMLKLDERANIVFQLLNYGLLSIFPDPNDPGHTWYAPGDNLSAFPKEDSLFVTRSFAWYLAEVNHSLRSGDWSKPDQVLGVIKEYQRKNDAGSHINPEKISAEIRYNNMRIFDRCKLGYFIFGGLLLVFAFMQLLKKRKWAGVVVTMLSVGIFAVFLFHIYGMGMRWYISGYAPWSNSYETMVYVAWATVLAGLVFGRKSALTMALATLFGGVILFVSSLNWMDPQIGTLVPVLRSPWLMFHVAVIVAAYGFFGIGFLLGITNLSLLAFSKKNPLAGYRIRELSIINNMALMVGLALMSIGTFLGAIWANESWGRYWGWDPKETWALITMIVYTVVTHLHIVKKWNSDWLFNLLSVFAFSSVLMTFLGVNYLLSGMHSYGQTDGVSAIFLYIAVAFAAIGVLGIISSRNRQIDK